MKSIHEKIHMEGQIPVYYRVIGNKFEIYCVISSRKISLMSGSTSLNKKVVSEIAINYLRNEVLKKELSC